MAAFTLNMADLEFILKQIKVSEAHASGAPLTQIYVDAAGNVVPAGTPGAILAIPDPHVPVGLRTVDGRDNNIIEGREGWGAADRPMPRLLEAQYLNDTDGDSIDLNGAAPGGVVNNGNYGNSGNVADADPRIISNLIVDMSVNNPAAVIAALTFAGSEDPYADLESFQQARTAIATAQAAVPGAQAGVTSANAAVAQAVASFDPNNPATVTALQDAIAALGVAQAALSTAQVNVTTATAAFAAMTEDLGLVINDEGSLVIPNVAPDEGLSAPFNAWMTFFGQFFDHGLDLITKGGNGTVYVPLQPDDPLYVEGGRANFMVLTRAVDQNGEHTNTTTSWVDQNQTYTSHASHQVFLREYKFTEDTNADGIADARAVATGRLLDGTRTDGSTTVKNGLPTWADIKAQAQTMLGLTLSDVHVHEVPLLATDQYGMFERGPNGYAQVLVEVVHDGGTTVVKVEGKAGGLDLLNITEADLPAAHGLTGITEIAPLGTRHAFLDDIEHNAVPTGVFDPDGPGGPLSDTRVAADEDNVADNDIATDYRGRPVAYDDELLDAHFITGDGRGNENIGLTAVHHIFHSEHNRQTESQKLILLRDGDLAFLNEWLDTPITADQLAAIKAGLTAATNQATFLAALEDGNTLTGIPGLDLNWNGERLFQAARFATEMQYQHLVFEEFARKVQPAIDVFVFNSVTDIDASIFAEFANVVYRFGHSMLTDSMPRIHLNEDGTINETDDMGLIGAFLNPLAFGQTMDDPSTPANEATAITAEQAAGAIVRGMTVERGNEIDEFVTGSLRNSLLGLPLDLAAINIARGRDTGMPTLNEARQQLYAATGSTFLTPYDSWTDFAANLKNPVSVVNFIAAYGLHGSILAADTVEEKRDAAWALVFGEPSGTATTVPADRLEFLNSLGGWNAGNSGLNTIDLWIGGLAEKKMPFGGMLGSTFNAVFEAQLEALQDGDRFYYLTRVQGQNFLNALEQNSFAKMIMANTDIAQPGPDGIRGTADDIIIRHIGVDSFAAYDYVLEVNAANQEDYNPEEAVPGGPLNVDPVGTDAALEAMGLGKVVRNNPGTAGPDANYLRFTGGEHIVVGGTNDNDTIITDFGDDGIWGGAGDDRIESGAGVDLVNGGAGDDIITDSGDSGDFLKGDEGNDVIANSNGIDILMGGSGKDVIFVGVDDTEVFGGEGDDFILGGDGVDFLMGNEGNDWIEAGAGFDTTAGDNSELFFNSTIIGHDVMFAGSDEHDFDAESGDDIMVQGESVMRNEGMFGFDWAIFKGVEREANADMRIKIFTTEPEDILRNRFDKTEALSGWKYNDTLIGDERTFGEIAPGDTVATTENVFFQDGLDQAGIDRIAGLSDLVQVGPTGFFESGNVLLGGAGSDLLQGNGGDDILDGDRWLNVRISITDRNNPNTEIATVDSLKHVFPDDFGIAAWQGKSLFELMINRVIRPDQMHIVREVLDAGPGDPQSIDTAVFRGNRDQYEIEGIDFADDGDEQTIVRHLADPTLAGHDGVDKVSNIERLQFADQVVELVPGLNALPVGQPQILGFAQIGQLLSIRLNDDGSLFGVTDPDNVGGANTTGRIFPPFSVEWQIEQDPGVFVDTGFRGLSFTPAGEGEFEVGADVRVRAIIRYDDGHGVPNSVASVPTDPLVPATNLVATEGDDILVGTQGSDTIDGLGGNDAIFGLGGNDNLTGGAGDDEIFGGDGDDTLGGDGGNDILDGGAGVDTAVFSGARANFVFEFNAEGQLEVVDEVAGEEDAVIGIERFVFDDVTLTLEQVLAGLPTQATEGDDTIIGTAGDDEIAALGGNDTITALDGADAIAGGLGNDFIDAGAGDDDISWEAGDGRDVIDGGAGTDRLRIRGSVENETFFIETRADYLARTGAAAEGLQASTEIVVSRSVGAGPSVVITELTGVDEIDVNGGGGDDSFVVSGNFAGTDLDPSTITIDGTNGNDTVDISGLASSHRIVFRSNGGEDTIIGTLRPQDVVELASGTVISGYTLNDNSDGTRTLTNGTHSITFTGTVPPQFVPPGDGDGGFELTARDIQGLKNLVQGKPAFEDDDDTEGHEGIRDLEGTGNNIADPDFGSADQPFIRLTDARYGDPDDNGNRDINPIFAGLDPRDISDILGEQEAGLPKQANGANIFFMAFGQYFDHGLDFLPKNSAYGKIEIGGPDEGAPHGSTPADLTRGEVHGFDEDGNPQHLNKTSPYVDQNQAYGSNELVGQFLRESDGNQGVGMRLLQGALDPSNPDFNLLPTLRELIEHHWEANTIFHDASLPGGQISFREYYSNYPVPSGATGNLLDEATGAFDPDVLNAAVSNFMGSGFPLLLDTNPFVNLLDHYVAGDGRANENFALTAMHTIWARNHNFHVEKLLEAGFDGTDEEVFQAAKMLNEAEYQRVVFDEFAEALIGGIRGTGSHGHAGYNDQVDARISHEFAAAVYRVGHSLIGQTMTILDENGQPKQVALFDAFLNPSNDPAVFTAPLPPGYVPQPGYAQLGVSSILGGIARQPAEEVDFNIVDAVRNDLVRINADLFSFNVARGRDVGLGTLNQVRADLKASLDPYIREAIGFAGNMDPYASWQDFQTRNGLSNAVIAQFMEAYPDLVLQTQEEIDAFVEVNPDIQLQDGPNGSKIVKGIDRVDLWVGGLAEKHINGGMVGQTFWVVLHEQFDRLQEGDRFYYLDRFDNFDFYEDFIDGQEFADIVARNTGLTDLPERIFEADLDDEDEDDDDTGSGDDDDEDEDEDDEDEDEDDEDEDEDDEDDDEDDDDTSGEDDDDTTVPPPPVQPGVGTSQADVLVGTAAADNLIGLAGDDVIVGHGGDDAIVAGEGNDFVNGGDGRDVISANAGDDHVFAGAGADMVYGDAGDDRLFGDAGDDLINGGSGNDTVVGGAGNDVFVAEAGDGNDSYFGDEPSGGTGIDTIDLSAITSAAVVDLGTGVGGHGSVKSAQTGSDTLWGVENVIGGSGADSITASEAVNVMDGGAGNDTFRFLSAAAADGDTIVNFHVGDRIDLTGIDANSGVAGNQAFTLVAGPTFTAAAQLMVSYETRADGDYTVIQGNTGGDNAADFKLSLKGTHELVPDDFKL